MGEITREELAARLESMEARMEARMDARAHATDSKIEALQAKVDALGSATDSKINARLAEFEARIQKSFTDLIKWMVGTAIATMAVGLTFLIFFFNTVAPRQPAPIVITVPAASAPATPR